MLVALALVGALWAMDAHRNGPTSQNAQRMATKIPALLGALRSETSARLATGRIKGTEF